MLRPRAVVLGILPLWGGSCYLRLTMHTKESRFSVPLLLDLCSAFRVPHPIADSNQRAHWTRGGLKHTVEY